MSKQTEAFRRVLKDLERSESKLHKARAAIREALAEQPAQQRHISYVCPQCHWSLDKQPASKPWVGLTRDEIMDIINRFAGKDWVYAVDAIEAKLKEKNT